MISLDSFVFYVGAIYLGKIILNLLLSIKNGLYAFASPTIFAITNFKKKYGEWAVITGCTQGIGKCYAEELAQRGMNIVLVSRSQSKLDDVAKEISKKYGTINVRTQNITKK